jgi:hypothetical protein
MMENQTPSLEEIGAMIAEGNVEQANAYINGETPSEAPEPMIETPETSESDLVTIEPEAPSMDATEPEEAATPENEEEFVNPLDEQRRIADELERERIETEKALKNELEAEKTAAREREEALLKQVEEARIAAEKKDDEEFSFFEDGDSGTEAVEAATPVVEEAPKTTDDIKERMLKLEQELAENKARDAEKNAVDAAVRGYTKFWNSPEGEKLKPKGMDAEATIRQLDTVYDSLIGKLGNEVEAKRALHDLRNPDTAEIYKDKLGIELPDEYDKMYDSWAVSEYAKGYKLDPVTGRMIQTGTRLETMEDAYYLMNKQKMLYDARLETYNEINNKLTEHREAARTPEPALMQPVSSSSNISDDGYRMGVLNQLKKIGYNIGKPLTDIKDPELRGKAAELFKNMPKI